MKWDRSLKEIMGIRSQSLQGVRGCSQECVCDIARMGRIYRETLRGPGFHSVCVCVCAWVCTCGDVMVLLRGMQEEKFWTGYLLSRINAQG